MRTRRIPSARAIGRVPFSPDDIWRTAQSQFPKVLLVFREVSAVLICDAEFDMECAAPFCETNEKSKQKSILK
jgi:hypothetical protein